MKLLTKLSAIVFLLLNSAVVIAGEAIETVTSDSAAPAAQPPQSSIFLDFILPLLLVVILFYLLILRPQNKRMREQSQMIESLHKGDKVMIAGGIEAVVSKTDPDSNMMEVEIAQGVKIKVTKASVSAIQETKSEKTDSQTLRKKS